MSQTVKKKLLKLFCIFCEFLINYTVMVYGKWYMVQVYRHLLVVPSTETDCVRVCAGVCVCILFLFLSESCHLILMKFMIFHCNVRAL